ncbi:unnamed protein product, partial [Iphiclides podalirius]
MFHVCEPVARRSAPHDGPRVTELPTAPRRAPDARLFLFRPETNVIIIKRLGMDAFGNRPRAAERGRTLPKLAEASRPPARSERGKRREQAPRPKITKRPSQRAPKDGISLLNSIIAPGQYASTFLHFRSALAKGTIAITEGVQQPRK